MEQQPADDAPGQGVHRSAADKIGAAFELLASAFQDSRADSGALSKADLLEQIVAAQQLANITWAVQSVRLAQVGAVEEVVVSDATSPDGVREHLVRHPIGGHQEEFIGAEIGPLLGWTTGHAHGRVQEATDVITRTPRLFARVGTGQLEPAKLAGIHRALGRVTRETIDDGTRATVDLARKVEAALLGDPDDAGSVAEAAAVEDANAQLLARQSAPQVQHRTGRILRSLDPVAADRAATRRRRDRLGVFAHPDDEPGLTHLHAILPSAVAAQIMAAIEQHARALHADTSTGKTLAECRADAIADLILSNATVTTHLIIQVPVHAGAEAAAGADAATGRAGAAFAHPVTGCTVFPDGTPDTTAPAATGAAVVKSQDQIDREFNDLLKRLNPPDPDDWDAGGDESDDRYLSPDPSPPDTTLHGSFAGEPRTRPPGEPPRQARAAAADLRDATVPGIGVIPAAVIQAMSRSFGTTLTRALIDADTGITLQTCETRYRPSPKLQHFVQTRDQHCRFPGCTHPATRCDLDHVIPWPQGPTAAYNLHALCRHHHRTKQAHGWTVTMTPDGVCTWTSPAGHTYVTTPGE